MLAPILRDLTCARDVSKVFLALGYQEEDLPFEGGAVVVARWRSFKVVADDGPAPRDRARALARRLSTLAERGLAAAVGPPGELVLAAPRLGAPGVTKLLVVPLPAANAEAAERLEALRPAAGGNALSHALRVADVLTSEAAGNRFFTAFRMMLERMAGSLDRRHSPADRRMMALLALSRVLFLYFVQVRGWLDRRPDYLRSLLDETLSRRRSFHRDALHPLFFGTLNRPPERRSRRVHLGRVPYLNGGLFEPHDVERRLGPACFANELWRDAFDDLFERFRFCVREADEVDTVAPDMLGRVFERLMDGDERHDSGTYYTPVSVVRQIVDATVETALADTGGLTPELAARVVRRETLPGESGRALAALRSLRVLDPAAGSGAFLLGALESLTEMRLPLEPFDRSGGRRSAVKRDVLRRSLFGVDVNPVAVRLAELRLWLAVVADDPSESITDVAPLPNLDGVVRQGDALLDPLGAARVYFDRLPGAAAAGARAVRDARAHLFDARGPDGRTATRSLRTAELRVAGALLERALESTDRSLAELTAVAEARDLFGRRTGLTVELRERQRVLSHNRRELERAAAALRDGAMPFFSFEVHAADVLARGGFSVVVGNPPWVRAERIAPGRRAALRERFSWWRGFAGRGYAHQPDIAVAFVQRSLELAAPGGAVGLLLPSKIASADYARRARRYLVRESTVAYAHRLPDHDAARFGATTYPLALVVRKSAPPPDHAVRLTFDGDSHASQAALGADGPWLLLPDPLPASLEELRRSGRPLGEVARPALGVKTGADPILVGVLVELSDGVGVVRFGDAEAQLELCVLRPALRGRDVRRFAARSGRVLLWGHDAHGAPVRELPSRAARYVRDRSDALARRRDYRAGPLWTLFRTASAVSGNRVVWPDIARRPRAVALDETDARHGVPLNTCYVAPAPDRETALVAAAVLNSTWFAALAAVTADEARGGYRRINARVAATVPLPADGTNRTALAELSARAHLGEHVDDTELDEAVADALALSVRARRALRRLLADHR